MRHKKVICDECGKVIMQCRCPCDKIIEKSICESCKGKQ